MYLICGGLGFGAGTSVLYITMSAEQFGTNLRASSAISIPNVVRGFLPLIILLHRGLRNLTGNYITGGWMTGIVVMSFACMAAWMMKESFAKDMDFVET
jgi:putative MFS transporter